MVLVTPTCSRGGRGGGVDVPTMSETANEEAPALDSPPSLACTRGAEQVDPQAHKDFLMGVKARWAQLCARDGELTAVIERATAEREAVRAEMASVNDKLDALIDAPVSGGHDPTLWLPDEIMELIFLMVPCEMLWDVCEHVCQRWRQIAQESSLVKQRKEKERWAVYEAGVIKPRVLEGHTDTVTSPQGSECGLVKMADTCRHSTDASDTQFVSTLSQWVSTARSILACMTEQSKCGLARMACFCRY